jgi:hypothetical protein
LLIWNTLLNADSETASAKYRPNGQYPTKKADSQLVCKLKNASWIPNINGEFFQPQNISQEDLPKAFVIDYKNVLLSSIGFGENAKKRSEEYKRKQQTAIDSGFASAETAAKWAAIEKSGINPDEVLDKLGKTEFPEDYSEDSARRRQKTSEQNEKAPTKEKVIRERSVQIGRERNTAIAKSFLRAKYTNQNNELICQCCEKEMPFKVDNEYYFEAVQLINETKKVHRANRIALCPTCAAMYLHARKAKDSEIISQIIDELSEFSINVELARKRRSIRFVKSHWLELRQILTQNDH